MARTTSPKPPVGGARPNPRGRPKGAARSDAALAAGTLSREALIEAVFERTRTESLLDISIVRLARDLKVRTAAVHYHVGSRNDLITGVMNRFYRTLLTEAKAAVAGRDGAAERVTALGRVWLDTKIAYPGIALYILAEDRYRLFQDPPEGEQDYGAAFADFVFALLREAGLAAERAAELWHMLALHSSATAELIARRHSPSLHKDFMIGRMRRYGESRFPGLAFGIPALADLDARTAFFRQLDILVAAFL